MKFLKHRTKYFWRQIKANKAMTFCFLRRIILGNIMVVCIGSTAQATATAQDWVAATSAKQIPTISAFASVQSSGLISIASAEPGVLADLTILPGQTVAAGQPIARLSGPQIVAVSVQAKAALTSALAAERAASASLAAEAQKLRQHLSTQQLLAQAKSALTAAKSQVTTAQANVSMLQQSTVLSSPLTGVVQSVTVANGDILATGQVAATIQPGIGNWLKAIFYGGALPAGATGIFTPGNGGNTVRVSVRGAFGVSQPDGGMPVALTASQPLVPGTFGTVTLDLPAQTVTMIPSEALILDKGTWWVMRHDASGDHPAQVTPGAAAGYDVVVVNAYLLYHRGIAALYQPPD
jgi:biotin carboxyl carrier protein